MTQDMTPREAALAERIERLKKSLSLICDTSERNADLCICEMKRIACAALDADGKGEDRG